MEKLSRTEKYHTLRKEIADLERKWGFRFKDIQTQIGEMSGNDFKQLVNLCENIGKSMDAIVALYRKTYPKGNYLSLVYKDILGIPTISINNEYWGKDKHFPLSIFYEYKE